MDVPMATNTTWVEQYGAYGRDHAVVWVIALVLLVASVVLFVRMWNDRDDMLRPEGPSQGVTDPWTFRWMWLVLAVASTAAFAPLAQLPAGQVSIVRLELIGQSGRAQAIVVQIASSDLNKALLFDVPFVVAYAILLAGLVLWTGSYFALAPLRRARTLAAYAVVAAGVTDLAEDLLIWLGSRSDLQSWRWPWAVAAAMAWATFAIVLVTAAYIVGGTWCWWALRAIRPTLLAQQQLESEDIDSSPDGKASTTGPELGIALSGGGIRAASISLGALQVLERATTSDEEQTHNDEHIGWDRASKVTAISGGSNMASGWSISRTTRYDLPGVEGNASRNPAGGLADPEPWSWPTTGEPVTPQERHLLLNLGYLVANKPRGDQTDPAIGGRAELTSAGTESYVPTAYATVFTGFLANIGVLLLILWVVARPLGWLIRWLAEPICRVGGGTAAATCVAGDPSAVWPGSVWVLVGLLGLVLWVLLAKVFGRRVLVPGHEARWRGFFQTLRGIGYGGLAIGVVLTAVLVGLPYLMRLVGDIGTGQVSLATIAGAGGTMAAVIRILRKPAARFAPQIGGLVFLLLVLFLVAYWANGAAQSAPGWYGLAHSNSLWWWVIVVATLGLVHVVASPEWWALAPFYRGKLRLAYANHLPSDGTGATPYRNDDGTLSIDDKEPPLFAYLRRGREEQPGHRGTPLTICATATTTTRAIRTHYGIPAMSLTFDPDHVDVFVPVDDQGKWGRYRCSTTAMDALTRRYRKRITTMMAVAISSAAVSPAMGRFRPGLTSMLLTFANIRLGVWLPNPRYVQALERGGAISHTRYPNTRLGYLAKEFFGIHDFSDPYLYMTDGGHWENTGIVEMLRSGNVTEIVAIDADLGAADAVRSVSQAIDLAMLECGVQIDIDLDPLRARVSNTNAPDYSARSVNIGFYEYRPRSAERRAGVIWYSKPALTTDMPASLLAYRETHGDYPRIATVDQFFDTSTFVAYRGLGRYNASMIRDARRQLLTTIDDAEAAAGSGSQFLAFVELDGLRQADDASHWACRELVTAVQAKHPTSPADQEAYYLRIKEAFVRDEPPA